MPEYNTGGVEARMPDTYIWVLRHPDGSAILVGENAPEPRDDGYYWLGPHWRYGPDGTPKRIGVRTSRYPADVWVPRRAKVVVSE